MNADEYLKLAEVEDQMWYFRSLHAHIDRELMAVFGSGHGAAAPSPRSGADSVATSHPHVLDAGCGTGGLSLRLRTAHPQWRFSAIDFMPLACELARKRCGPDVDIRVASITELPFPDATFDAVMPIDVISQVEDAKKAADECFRVLRPGGLLITNVPAYMWMWSYHDDSCQTKHRYTRSEVGALLTGAGFVQPRLTHWNALPFPLIWARRKLLRSSHDTSDVKAYPRLIDAGFGGMMALEHAWLRLGGRWAWGTSVFGAARKPLP